MYTKTYMMVNQPVYNKHICVRAYSYKHDKKLIAIFSEMK